MDIVARINFPDKSPPARAYVYGHGLEECFSGNKGLIHEALDYFEFVHKKAKSKIPISDQIDYFLGVIWGNKVTGEKTVDLFGFYDIKEWPGNPTVSEWVVRNGVFVRSHELTCGDTLIVLGKEESYRRFRNSLKEYLMNPPDIGREDAIPIRELGL